MTNILVLCDCPWHPAEVIQMGLKFLEGEDYNLTYIKDAKTKESCR